MLRAALLPLPLVLATLVLAAGDFPSGPNAGDKLKEFKVHAFSGPNAGKEIEVLKTVKDGPTLLIFVHQITRPALKLLRPLDEFAVKEGKGLCAHIIWLGEKDASEEYLKRAKDSLSLQTPIGISVDGKDGPPAYGLNDKVALTILVAKEGKVAANFALSDPNDKDARKVIAAVEKVLGKKVKDKDKEKDKN